MAFLVDTFTGSSGTDLAAHSPDTGSATSWVRCALSSGGSSPFVTLDGSGKAQQTTQVATEWWRNTTAPGGGEYDVQCDFTYNSNSPPQFGLFAKMDTWANSGTQTGYQFEYNNGVAGWALVKYNAGAAYVAGTPAFSPVVGHTYTLKMTVRNSSSNVIVTCSYSDNGGSFTTVVTWTDDGTHAGAVLSTNGFVGFENHTSLNNTVGVNMDNFQGTLAVTASFTTVPATGTVVVAGAAAQRVNFTVTGATWGSAPNITVPVGTLGAITLDTSTTAHANYTAPATAQTVTFTDVTDGNITSTLSVVAASTTYTLTGPVSGVVSVASTNFTVALPASTAVNAAVTVTPSDGGAGGTFTPSTVSLVANTTAASATFTYTPASTGTKTLSVTNSGGLTNPSNLSYSVSSAAPGAVNDPALFWSDTWFISGSSYAETNLAGSYVRFDVTGVTAVAVSVDVSPMTAASAASTKYPTIRYRVGTAAAVGNWTDRQLLSTDTSITLGSSLTAGSTYTVEVHVPTLDTTYTIARWASPTNGVFVKITAFTFTGTATTSASTRATNDLVVYGDSIPEGQLAREGTNDADNSFVPVLAKGLDAEYASLVFGGQGVYANSAGATNQGVPTFPSTYDHYWSGQTHTLRTPTYGVLVMGTNDGVNSVSNGNFQTAYQPVINALASAYPTTKWFLFVPFGGFMRTAIQGLTLPANFTLKDLNEDAGLNNSGTPTYKAGTDGIHPWTRYHAILGARMARTILQSVSSGGVRRVALMGGFLG